MSLDRPPALPVAWPVGVVGSGTMGSAICEVAARAGCSVVVVDSSADALAAAQVALRASLVRAEAKGRLAEPVDAVADRVVWSTDLQALAGRRVVVEAIAEDLAAKQGLFARLDDVVDASTILASNTSSIPISKLGAGTEVPGRVLGMHFFNPVPAMPLVEVVSSVLTDEAHAAEAARFVRDVLGKQVVTAPDRAGFLVNALLVPYLLSAMRALENGVGTREEIDTGMVGGCGMPMGPIALSDLVGLDVMLSVADSLYAEHLDPAYAAPPILRRHVEAGLTGRKSGRGFYTY